MIWLLLGVAFLMVVYFVFSNKAKKCVAQTIPGAYPIIGNLISVVTIPDNLARWVYDWVLKLNFASFEVTCFGDVHLAVIADSKQVEHMLKTNWKNYLNNTVKGRGFLITGKEFWGRGIFVADGEEWQAQRKAASHLFSLNALRNKMYHVFYEHTHKLIEILKTNVGKQIDLQLLFQNFAFDTICQIAFGVTPGAMESTAKPQFLIDFDLGQAHVQDRMQQPPAYNQAAKFLSLGREPEYQKACVRLTQYCEGIIQQRKQAGDLEDRGDLLSMFIAYGREKNQPELLTDAGLRDAIINFMVAGRDTTASTLTHLFKALSENPDVRTTLTESLAPMSLSGNVQSDVETIMKQDYLRMVMYESFRRDPAVPAMFRFAIQDDVMPGNFRVQAGALCTVSILAMNRDPKRWSDPLAFIPSRWEGKELPSDFEFPSFWAGPRVCLGRVMAQTEIMVAAGLLAKHFKFSVVGQDTFTMAGGPVWFFKEGLNVLVEQL